MALRVPLLSPKPIQIISNFPTNPFPSYSSIAHFSNASRKHSIAIACTNTNGDGFSDAELALKFASEVEKLNAQIGQREEALNKGRELLFKEFSNYMGLKSEEVKGRWKTMDDDDKLAATKEFVSGWSDHFHPLSARSAKALIEEYLADERKSPGDDDSGPLMFPSLRRLIGF